MSEMTTSERRARVPGTKLVSLELFSFPKEKCTKKLSFNLNNIKFIQDLLNIYYAWDVEMKT